MKTSIIIPARYASTRLPGKPLAMIAGQTMLQRVVNIALAAAQNDPDITVHVATEDARIADHCNTLGVDCLITSPECLTGTDRAEDAVSQIKDQPDFVLNLQGDAPLTPPDFLTAMIDAFEKTPCDMVTPVTQLSWAQLDKLRDSKATTPFSGTTAIFDDETGKAFWFSKQILPAMRKEDTMRARNPARSPVFRHIGLYGYSRKFLATYVTLPEGKFEAMEGLEQLRTLEHGYTIRCVPVDYKGRASMSGVDSPEDIARAEALIKQHGELI